MGQRMDRSASKSRAQELPDIARIVHDLQNYVQLIRMETELAAMESKLDIGLDRIIRAVDGIEGSLLELREYCDASKIRVKRKS